MSIERRLTQLEDAAQGWPRTGAQLYALVAQLPPDAVEHSRFYASLSDAELEAVIAEIEARHPDEPRLDMAQLSDAQIAALCAGEWPPELHDERYWLPESSLAR